MVKNIIHSFIFIFIMSATAFSQESDDAFLENWVKTAQASKNYAFSLLILSSGFDDKTAPVPAKINKDDIENTSYFQLLHSASLIWDININNEKVAKLTGRELLEVLTDAKFFLFAPTSGPAVFAKRDTQGRITKMFTLKNSTPFNWDKILIQVQKKLGWDGVVLQAAENKFIVGAPADLLKEPDIQALAIARSKDIDTLNKENRTGAGLLSLTKRFKGFALFESIFVDESNKISAGTKLIIEKRKMTPP
jgi:hypothetical protein